jgi:hypothetical protein
MIDEVMFEIRELTGQEYVNTYAGKSSDAAAETRPTAQPATSTDVAEAEAAGSDPAPAPASLVSA